jgi:hypothetical protein
MTYKQHILTHKPWSQTGNFGFSPAGIIAKLRNMVKIEVPVGYQDETGFHYGSKSAGKDSKWPTAW